MGSESSMNRKKLAVPALAAVACMFVATAAVGAEPTATGPQVGTKIPAVQARDQHGHERNFENLRGPNGLLLLFHRSADW